MQSHSYRVTIGLASLSALLSVLSFPPCSWSWLAWIALVPWLYSLTFQTTKQMLLSYTIFHAIFFGIGIFWMAKVHPICPIAILFPLWLMCLPFPLLYRWIVQKNKGYVLLAGPILWVANEYLRGFLFGGFPYLFLGHTQAYNFPTIIQIADLVGVYGVTFTIVTVNALIVVWLLVYKNKQPYPFIATALVAILVLAVWGYGEWRLHTISYPQGPKVASVQGNIPQDIKDNPKENYPKIIQAYTYWTYHAIEQKPDLIIWPETMAPEAIQNDASVFSMFQDITQHTQIPFLIGSHYLECNFQEKNYRIFNSAYLLDAQGKIQQRYDKIRLVIIGEFLPLRNELPFLPIIIRNLAGYIPDLARGETRPIFALAQNRFGAVICYDIAYTQEPQFYRQQGCQFVVNLTNEGWFMGTSELEQLLQISIFRAVEHRMGIVRSGNTGITAYIPPTGILDHQQILAIPIEQYWERLPAYQQNLAKENVLAWHHFPECLYDKNSSLITPGKQNWDILWQGKPYKWKDFPGVLCQPVPLATSEIPIYTQYGDFFAMFCFLLMLITFGVMTGKKIYAFVKGSSCA